VAKNHSVRSREIPAFSGTLAFAFLANAALRFRLKSHPDFFSGSKGPIKSGYFPAPSSIVSLPEDPSKEKQARDSACGFLLKSKSRYR